MRAIDTGRGISRTALSPVQIAELRPTEDPQLFMDAFDRYRGIVPSMLRGSTGPVDIDTLSTWARDSGATQEAALIEALASLRAEGVRL